MAPSKHGETLRFGLQVREIGRSSIKLGLTGTVENELRAKIEQTVVLFSLERRAMVPLPAELRQQMMQFAAKELRLS